MSAARACDKEIPEPAHARRPARRSLVLRKSAEFEAVLRSGRRFTSRNFVLRASPNTMPHPRLGIIAGRKSARRAVDRNRARRLVREAFRAAAATLGGYDVAIQVRNDLRAEVNVALRAELKTLLDQLVRRIASTGAVADKA